MDALFCSKQAQLSTNLFETYVQYKKDTHAITKWLLSNSSVKCSESQQLSVRDLLSVAEAVCQNAVAMPEIIGFHFRQAIAARIYLSKMFRKSEEAQYRDLDTINHEFFTESLTKMYHNLCRCCEKPKAGCHRRLCEANYDDDPTRCMNKFASLEVQENTEDAPMISEGKENQDQSLGDSEPIANADQHVHLAGSDEMCEQVSIMAEDVWAKAGVNEIHLLAASAVTNAACSRLERSEHRMTTDCGICDPSDLMRRCDRWQDDSACQSCFVVQMTDSWHSLINFETLAHRPDFFTSITDPQPPQISLRRGGDTSQSDSQCRHVLLTNISRCLHSLRNTFVRNGSPVYAEIGYFMSRERDAENSLHCTSGLSILLSSYKAYSFSLPPGQAPSRCRIQALRFAQGALKQIDAVLVDETMPCRCVGTLAYHLEGLKKDFEGYVSTKMFDFYFQSPWVCGSQMLEMLHALHYYGLRLLAYKSIVGSVVHMYHVLRCTEEVEQIPVLEALCSHLEQLFFPGGRPIRYFKNSYVRFLGGRLRFHGKKKHETGCHELIIPAHTAKATAGLSSSHAGKKDPRFDCGRFSLLFRIKERSYDFDSRDAVLPATPTGEPTPPGRRSRRSGSTRDNRDCNSSASPADTLKQLHASLQSELTSPFPIPRINFFLIYNLCARIIDRASDEYHDPAAKKGQYCLCCVEDLVAAADGCRAGKGWKSRKQIKQLVELSARIIREEIGGVTVDHILWQNT